MPGASGCGNRIDPRTCPHVSHRSHPHPFQGGVHLGFSESHRPADFEIGDQSGHAPAVEVAFAHAEVGAGVFFGE